MILDLNEQLANIVKNALITDKLSLNAKVRNGGEFSLIKEWIEKIENINIIIRQIDPTYK